MGGEEEEFGHADGENDAQGIRTIVPFELKRVRMEDEDTQARQEDGDEDDDQRRRRAELARSRTPEPMDECNQAMPHAQGLISRRHSTAVNELTESARGPFKHAAGTG